MTKNKELKEGDLVLAYNRIGTIAWTTQGYLIGIDFGSYVVAARPEYIQLIARGEEL